MKASVGADRFLCLVLAAVVRFGLVLEVLVHVHVVLAVDGFGGHHAGHAGFHLHAEGALDDGHSGLGTGRVAGTVRGHADGSGVDDARAAADRELSLGLLTETEGQRGNKNPSAIYSRKRAHIYRSQTRFTEREKDRVQSDPHSTIQL